MENASKALLMAGGGLIAMLMIAVAVFLFNTYSNMAPSYEKKISEGEVKKFNSNFTKFEGRTDITVQEIISIINFVKQYQEETEIEVKVIVKPAFDFTEGLIGVIEKNSLTNSIEDGENVYNIKTYTCSKIIMDGPFGTVSEIKFEEN